TQLRERDVQVASTFAGKIKAFATKVGKAVQTGVLRRKRRRILRQFGSKLRQNETDSSLAEEAQSARAVADRLSMVDAEIRQLAPQTYPWARRPLLLMCLLLVIAAIGGAFMLRQKPTPV